MAGARPFFAGMFGIFGHGNVAGVGQALDQMQSRMRYYQCRNEQAMVHTAAAFAKMSNRMRTLACTTSVGPGATNMVTGAAGATINRLPVLLLPGDIFASRLPAPVLQQLESSSSQDVSVNDCFKPVSRYWDRISRPEQLITSLPEAMRVLTSPSDTGAVTLSLPEDTQTEAFDYPPSLFHERVWTVPRPRGDADAMRAGGRSDSLGAATRDHCRWRRAVQRGGRGAGPLRRRPPASALSKHRPARAACRGITPSRWDRSARPAVRRPTRSRAKPTW